MSKQNSNTTEHLKSQDKGNRKLFLGGIVVLLIAAIPFLLYAYKSFPDTQVWETSLFSATTGFESWFAYAWYLTGKIVPLYILLLWFFTCKHWWHWIILVPIAIYSFQLWGLINESQNYDEVELYYVIPLMAVVVPLVYLIRAKLFNKIRGNDLQSFEEELKKEHGLWGQLKDLFR